MNVKGPIEIDQRDLELKKARDLKNVRLHVTSLDNWPHRPSGTRLATEVQRRYRIVSFLTAPFRFVGSLWR